MKHLTKDINAYFFYLFFSKQSTNNSFLMIYSQESEIHSICSVPVLIEKNFSNVCLICIIIKNDLPKKYQIGIMYPMKKGDKNDK